jgi:hypothetical protein
MKKMNRIPHDKMVELMQQGTRSSISPKPPKGLNKEGLFYWKLKYDFPFYAEHFLRIRDKNSNLVNFKLNEAQIIMENIDKYCKDNNIPRRYIILKARQMGMSTYTEGKLFHETANNPLTRSLILAHEETASSNLYRMSKMYYEELPDELRPMKKYNNGKILSFENPTNDESDKKKNPGLRSSIQVATAGAGEVARSATFTKLHASEVAFFPDAKTTMLGLMQTIPDSADTLVIWESTANGVGDFFNQQWNMAVNGESDFIPVFLPWFTDSLYSRDFYTDEEREEFITQINYTSKDDKDNDVYTYEYELMNKYNLTYEQLNWRRWAIRNKCQGDDVLFMQEYPSTPEEAFISTGRPVFNTQALKKYQTITKAPERGYLRESGGSIKFIPDKNGYVSIWQQPEVDKFYCIGADVAEGLVDGDYSVGIVGDPDSMDMVAMWHGKIDHDLFGVELIKLARFYNDAYLGVENNNHGASTLNTIKRNEYWNLYFSKQFDKIADKLTQKVGWTTSSRTKPIMIDKLAEFVREKWLGIYSDLIISEMFTYIIEDNGSTNAQKGCHDDCVMSAAICLQLMLEGKDDNYEPEVPFEGKRRGNTYAPDIIDSLFERNNDLEVAE